MSKIIPTHTKEIDYSVVMIGRNCEKTIVGAVSCVKELLGGGKVEIIYVDDKSSDSSVAKAKKICDRIIINKKRSGIALSRLAGIKKTRSKIVFIFDADIILTEVNLMEVNNLFEQGVVLISGKYTSYDNSNFNRILDARRIYIYGKNKKALFSNKNVFFPISGGFCIINNASQINHYKGATNIASEDILLEEEILANGQKIAYLPTFSAQHNHYRGFYSFLKKIISETRGFIWILDAALSNGNRLPYLEQAFSVPIFLLLSLLVKNIYIILFLLLVEYSPQLITIILYPSLLAIELLILSICSSILRLLFFLHFLLLSLAIPKRVVRLSWYFLTSDFLAKKNWFRIFYFNNHD